MAELGWIVPDWRAPPRPGPEEIAGAAVQLERLDPMRHAADLAAATAGDPRAWDYLMSEPVEGAAGWRDYIAARIAGDDVFYAIRPRGGPVLGLASYLRIAPEAGSIEVGNILFSAGLRRSLAATEAMFLMMGWAFDAGYRRYEWKCNALNLPSRRAAQRLGLSYEGVFRQALVVKGRNRDTAWFAAVDGDWPALRAAWAAWAAEANQTATGQIRPLTDWTAPILAMRDPAL